MIRMLVIAGEPDATTRGCDDCDHCRAAVSWWCTSRKASAARGTSLPGTVDCEHWTPAVKSADLSWWERWKRKHSYWWVPVDLTARERG